MHSCRRAAFAAFRLELPLCVLAMGYLCAAAAAQQNLSYADLVGRLYDLERLAVLRPALDHSSDAEQRAGQLAGPFPEQQAGRKNAGRTVEVRCDREPVAVGRRERHFGNPG